MVPDRENHIDGQNKFRFFAQPAGETFLFFEISPTDSPSSGITQNTTKRKTKMSIRNEIAKYKYSCTPNAKTDDALISAPTKTISRLSNLFKQSHLSRPSLVPRLPTTHAYVGLTCHLHHFSFWTCLTHGQGDPTPVFFTIPSRISCPYQPQQHGRKGL